MDSFKVIILGQVSVGKTAIFTFNDPSNLTTSANAILRIQKASNNSWYSSVAILKK